MAHRNWLCTLNNPTVPGQTYLQELYEKTGATYLCGQLEKAASGTLHLQFFLNFSQKARISKITKVDSRIHCEPVVVNNGADTYCMKEETRVEGPWTFGIRPIRRNTKVDWEIIKAQAKANQLDEIPGQIYVAHYSKLKAIAKDHIRLPPDCPHTKGVWIYGPTGCGKSSKARQDYPGAYTKSCNKWWEGYNGQKAVIMDDIGLEHECLGHHLKIWSDHYSCLLETKGGAIASNFEWFVVTSQYHIDEIFKDERTQDALKRRFKVINFLDQSLSLVKRPPLKTHYYSPDVDHTPMNGPGS